MIAYNEKSLDQVMINNEADEALRKLLITKEEHSAVIKVHPVALYRPNIFIRIGLFLATVVIAMMSFGLVMLFVGSLLDSGNGFAVFCAVFAVFIYAGLEWLIHNNRHYRSGVDDALLWLAFGFIVSDVSFFMNLSTLQQCIFIFVLSACATVRFANSVMSGIVFISFLFVIFYSIVPLGPFAKAILPFLIMAISFAIYLIVIKNKKKTSLRHYRFCLLMVEVLSLIAVYAAVNYFAVRELSNELFNLQLPKGASIPGGWFFWITTLLIPPLYIARALQTKDAVMLRIGMFLLAATVLTVHEYYSIAPPEQVMAVGGLILIAAAYFIIRLLRTPKYGITDKEPENEHSEDSLQLEALVVSEAFRTTPAAGPGDGARFGGGTAGGGGATGGY